MTTIETKALKIEEGEFYGNLGLTENDTLERKGKIEVVREIYEDGRFRTVRRDGDGIIVETGYCIDKGILKINFSGVCHREDTPPYKKSERYFELNDFLQKLGK